MSAPVSSPPPLQIWGGAECSFVRLAYGPSDQQERTGHFRRPDDLERFAALGLRTLRFPILWEHHHGPGANWARTDARMQRLRELGIRPIVGLLHHGCGPLPEGFLDPAFVDGLAVFARTVAERYPWVDAYTPINEPLTTARFSALYGLWHPYHRDVRSFAHCHVRQCEAIRAAMRAIRRVTPGAELVQTEDLGKTHSTAALAYQAEFENERRWLTFDLLAGRVAPGRWMHRHLRAAGVGEAALASFVADPCPPDLLGMNYYVTSERLLDERLENYPPDYHGGNDRQAYADVPAVRARLEGAAGPAALMRELWRRYHRPFAVTEVQLACTRDEQLRWLQEVWSAAQLVRRDGVDVRAVTAWALLGAYDWDSLLLRPAGHYENGAFDVSGPEVRRTALADAIASIAATGAFDHPAAHGPGWWRRPTRFTFLPVSAPRTGPGTAVTEGGPSATRPLAIVSSCAHVAAEFIRACDLRGLAAVVARDDEELQRVGTAEGPWSVLRPGQDFVAGIHAALDDLIDARAS